ncbi:LysE family translocator [Marinomonas mediterranea]|uniref:LysE family translocator n=1 Tax=Marinomonas mediterranea TaxID=119864 RepID=UPI0021D7BA91|nr:LysE family translocator [Marinomonas mediterranea]
MSYSNHLQLGFGVLLQSSPTWFLYAKVVGGSYLIYIGLKSLLSKKNSSFHIDNNGASVKKNTAFSIFLEAFLVSASNPKTVIFLSAFLPQFIDVNHSANEQFLIMFLTICLIVTVVHIGYSIGIHHIKKYFSEKKFNSYLSKITSSVFVLMGIAVLSSNKS